MNNILYKVFFVIMLVVIASCEDDITTSVSGVAIEDTDLIQVDDTNPYVTVYFTAQSSNLSKVSVAVTSADGGGEVYSSTISHITADKLNRVKVNVPFPTPDIAPSGMYTVKFTADGKTSTYSVNVINNRTVVYCDEFPSVPSGKIGVFVSVPGGADVADAGKDIFIVGAFQGWDPGNPSYKLTKLGEQCYYIFIDPPSNGDEFKFTLGDWDHEFQGPKGESLGNMKYTSGNINATIYNWKNLSTTTYELPEVLPSAAIATGKETVVVDISTTSDKNGDTDIKYYLVPQGASNLDNAIQLTRVVGTTKVAAAVAKNNGDKYIVVKDAVANRGVNYYGFDVVVTIDDSTNPQVGPSVRGFLPDYTPTAVPTQLSITGDFSGWNNTDPMPAAQQFTNEGGNKFSLTVNPGTGGYLLLPVAGSWDFKIGMGGANPLEGDLVPQGSNFSAPAAAGTYKIEVDFNTATYKLTAQ